MQSDDDCGGVVGTMDMAYKKNEYMIRHCDDLIAYDKRLVGKTRDFVDLARRLEAKGLLREENLADALRE